MGFKEEVITRLDKLTERQQEHTVQLVLCNKILDEHHKRSTQLETRVLPLEHSHIFTTKLLKAILSIITLIAACASAYHYLFKP